MSRPPPERFNSKPCLLPATTEAAETSTFLTVRCISQLPLLPTREPRSAATLFGEAEVSQQVPLKSVQ